MRSAPVVALLLSLGSPALAGAAVAPATTLAQPVAFEHGSRAGRRVALTFDACTTRGRDPYDPRIPRILDALHVPATVFVGGGWAQEEAPALRALASDPLIELGNHTFTHPHLTRLTGAGIRDELLRTQAEIAAVTGRIPTLFRPPYGEYDAHVLRAAAGVGLTTVEYDLPSGDPDPHATARGLVEWVLREARPGSIIVMHLNHPRFHTAEALPAIVDGLRARGFDLVTVGDLLRDASTPAGVLATRPPPPARAGHHRDHVRSATATAQRQA
jgi:peptidoglycan/xylan/chitin deacetylase (PgdA/CDA1 family)